MPCKSILSILNSKASQLSAAVGSLHCPLHICSLHLWSHLSVQFKAVILFYFASFCLSYYFSLCLSLLICLLSSLLHSFYFFFLCPKRNVSACISHPICLVVSVVHAVSLVPFGLAYCLILSHKYDSFSESACFSALQQ